MISALPSPQSPATNTSSSPSRSAEIAAIYASRRDALSQEEAKQHRRHLQLGWLRLFLGLAFVALLFPPRWYALVPLLAFLIAARVHSRVLTQLAKARRVSALYGHALARVEDRWAGLQPRSVRRDLNEHLYAIDLDLVGDGSLFELLCEARTTQGEDTLLDWLLTPASPDELRERQAAVAELRDRLPLREAFAAAKGPRLAEVDRPMLAAWGAMPPVRLPMFLRFVAPVLVVLTLLAAWRYAVTHSPLLLVALLVVDASLTYSFGGAFRSLYANAVKASHSLQTVAELVRLVEEDTFTSSKLVELQAALRSGQRSASAALRLLARLVRWADERNNYLVRILDTPLLYSLQLSLALERWRRRAGPQLDGWLRTLGEFEALLSLAAYSYEHPADPFPTFATGPASYVAKELGHPLIPQAVCVRNPVSLGAGTQLLLVSGSNMSGKSTLLRSVGVNAVLAFAGAPVRAQALSLTPMTLAASIHVNDSLQAGHSRFYAEILRLRAIAMAAQTQAPLLFLLDEVLAGTNSSDRLAGTRGLAKDLLDAGALGMISTHDLALTVLAVKDAQRIRNAHFEDQIGDDDQLRFDYRLRNGVLQRSNGLALMRLIGLHV